MTDTKNSIDEITRIGAILIAFNFCVGEFCRDRAFSHDPISDMIIRQKITIGPAGVALAAGTFMLGWLVGLL